MGTAVVSRAITGSMVALVQCDHVTHVSTEKCEVCLQRHDCDLKLDCIPDDMGNIMNLCRHTAGSRLSKSATHWHADRATN